MAQIDLGCMSMAELRVLQDAIPAELQKRSAEDKKAVLEEIRQIAKSKGYSLNDLLEGGPAKPAKRKLAPAYRHPTDSNLTWSGRGRQPGWLAALVAAGSKVADFAV